MPDATGVRASTRTYTSTLRAEQAASTRQRILDAAAERFGVSGYAGTSLADIAQTAGVSVETVKLNGPKRDLLLAAFEQAFAGAEGAESIAERDIGRALIAIDDPDALLAGYVHFVAAANARTSGLWSSFLAASSSDVLVRRSLEKLLLRRRSDFQRSIALFHERGMIQSDREHGELADALSFLVSPESHEQLVGQSGWSLEHYRTWLADAIRRCILKA